MDELGGPKAMPSVALESLPANVRAACEELRDGLRSLLGEELVALWVHGAATFPDRPERLGDIDTHGILANRPDRETAAAIERIHDSLAARFAIEWDSWYVLKSDATRAEQPRHALRKDLVDDGWALHRAHWLAGQYVLLCGCEPREVVQPPSWEEIHEGLQNELIYIERGFAQGRPDPQHAAYSVWNGCRILYSLVTRDVVVSKRAAARWALEHLPASWHAAIRAAGRSYDGEGEPGDETVLKAAVDEIVASVRKALAAE
jgi:hypothetical protein